MEKDNKCYFCNKLAVAEKRVVVDVEADHDINPDTGEEVWYSHPIYSTVGVCQEHLEAEEGDEDEIQS